MDGGIGRKRIGLLGGTFDPPHVGHLWLAETARDQLQLDRVLFLPAGQPIHKQDDPVTAASHRLAMTHLAINGCPHFVLDTSDVRREPPHATYTLLPLIRQAYSEASLWLIIGSDSLSDFPTWRQPEKVVEQCRLAVLSRPGVKVEWDILKAAVREVESVVDWLDGPTVAISGTEIRRWARLGRSLRYLVPVAVADYIDQHGLYNQ